MLRFPVLVFASLACSFACARDLTLEEAQALLVQGNRDLQAARRAVESADAQRLVAGARPNATFSINSTGIGSNAKPDTVFRIDQPFERGHKRELRLDAAAGLRQAAQQDFLDVLRQQLATLQGSYFDLKLAQEKALTLTETAQLFAGTLAAAERRLQAGDLATADVAKVRVDYERAQGANEIQRAASDLNAAAERVERFDGSLLGAANRSAEASEFAFSRGALSVLEVLDARRTLRAVRLEALAARADFAKALAAWRAAQASAAALEAR